MNCRVFVEKKEEYRTEAEGICSNFKTNLKLDIKKVRLINIYDVFDIDSKLLEISKYTIFGEKVTDDVALEMNFDGLVYFAMEFLPGQFDQRADSAMQCLRLIDPQTKALVRSGKVIVMEGNISNSDLAAVKKYFINEVEAREKDLSVLLLAEDVDAVETKMVYGFCKMDLETLTNYRQKMGLAMSDADLYHVQKHFINDEKRDPSETEIRMLDTYWSDHCRHTTFETELRDIKFSDDFVFDSFKEYLEMRDLLKRVNKPVTLMDMATINSRYEKFNHNLEDLEVSEENNACSVYIDVDVDNKDEKWLMMFKNETHNHPTEIEPFGGASTCIGGAIRDPLSGRSYVYQAMRVTGAGDITKPIEDTIVGKLPQKNISKTAAAGYSSYGNQIGLATTHVREIYHEGYVAKRMEVGAVVGAIKADMIRRESPAPGDIIIMLGGKTGRDGIGGATGSSKEHTEKSIELCSSEVQKGNAPEERKIQRLFRNPEVVKMIKKSNDFGAGGVSVAIGELADGLEIDLDAVKVKYKGLNGTELTISESQERMSVVVEPKDVEAFIRKANQENIEAVVIAKVTNNNRLVINHKGKKIVDISRDFINTNGVRQRNFVTIEPVDFKNTPWKRVVKGQKEEQFKNNLKDLNVSMQKGLIEMFDATIGATTVLMPFGGKYQLSETQVSAQKIPVLEGNTNTCSVMSFGYNPYIAKWSPYHGAMYSVVECLAKLVSAGVDYHKVRFSFQEYFERLGKNPLKWGKVTAAMLGSIEILKQFKLASIGGKDSMSGTFKDLDVPPTLIAFGIAAMDSNEVISTEFKKVGNKIYLIKHDCKENFIPNVEQLKNNFQFVRDNIVSKKITSAFALTNGGLAEALAKMSYGNMLGVNVKTDIDIYENNQGSILVEADDLNYENALLLGEVTSKGIVINDIKISTEEALKASLDTFEKIYPTIASEHKMDLSICKDTDAKSISYGKCEEEVRVAVPVFPGTNCDYDSYKAFKEAGATPEIFVFRNTKESDVDESIKELAALIDNSHILMISGGFSAGDEPDGSGKFISNVLNNQIIKNSINRLIERKGLILGICNGFQALVKSGLFNNWEVKKESPTLFRNDINRHVSHIATTRVTSNKSPWLKSFKPGDVFEVAMSHGEGKFVINKEDAIELFNKGLVAFQYANFDGEATMDPNYNINGSFYAIEGIISENGQILGKMGHSERKGNNVFKNIYGNKKEDIFANAIKYFRGE